MSIALVPLGVRLLAGPGAIVATVHVARETSTPPEQAAIAGAAAA